MYNVGETASFKKELVDKLIEQGTAQLVKGKKPSTKKPEAVKRQLSASDAGFDYETK
jgi:hypothetical protein